MHFAGLIIEFAHAQGSKRVSGIEFVESGPRVHEIPPHDACSVSGIGVGKRQSSAGTQTRDTHQPERATQPAFATPEGLFFLVTFSHGFAIFTIGANHAVGDLD